MLASSFGSIVGSFFSFVYNVAYSGINWSHYSKVLPLPMDTWELSYRKSIGYLGETSREWRHQLFKQRVNFVAKKQADLRALRIAEQSRNKNPLQRDFQPTLGGRLSSVVVGGGGWLHRVYILPEDSSKVRWHGYFDVRRNFAGFRKIDYSSIPALLQGGYSGNLGRDAALMRPGDAVVCSFDAYNRRVFRPTPPSFNIRAFDHRTLDLAGLNTLVLPDRILPPKPPVVTAEQLQRLDTAFAQSKWL